MTDVDVDDVAPDVAPDAHRIVRRLKRRVVPAAHLMRACLTPPGIVTVNLIVGLVFLQWIPHCIHWDKSVCVGRTRRVSTVDFDGRTDGLTDGRVSVVFTYRRFCCVWTTHAASRWEFDLI